MTELYVSADRIDITCLLRILATLQLTGRMRAVRDEHIGELTFDRGRLVAARYREEHGLAALAAMLLAMPTGQFTFVEADPAGGHDVELSSQALESFVDPRTGTLVDRPRGAPPLMHLPHAVEPAPSAQLPEEVVLPRGPLSARLPLDGRRTVAISRERCGWPRAMTALVIPRDRQLIGAPAGSHLATLAHGAHRAPMASALVVGTVGPLPRPTLVHRLAAVCLLAGLISVLLMTSWRASGSSLDARATAVPPATVAGAARSASAPGSMPASAALPAAARNPLRTVLDERFATNALRWPDDPGATAWIADSTYQLRVRDPGQFVAIGAPVAGDFRDIVVAATFRKVGGPPGGGYGLIVRDRGPGHRDGINQTGNFYLLGVSGQGVGIRRREDQQWVDVAPWTPSRLVQPDGTANELVALAIGERLALMVNGTVVATVQDSTLADGAVGIFVSGDGNHVALEHFLIEVASY